MRSRDSNPFRPGAGAVPDVWVGRQQLLLEHARRRRDRTRGRYTTGVVIVGPSGIGKSVLVNRMATDGTADGDVLVEPVRIAKRSDPVAQLAGAVARAGQHVVGARPMTNELGQLLDRLDSIAVHGVKVTVADPADTNPHLAVRDALVALATRLAHENADRPRTADRALVVRIDELQNATNAQRSALIAALGDVLEATTAVHLGGQADPLDQHLPAVVLLTGLPDLLNAASNVDTFRRRFTTHVLRPFPDAEVEDALLDADLPDGVTVKPAAATELARIVCGDPYLFQLVGHHAWNAGTGDTITVDDVATAADQTYSDRLRMVEAAAADIPAGEQGVLDALLAVVDDRGLAAPKDVADQLGTTLPKIATAAGRLERRAVIERRPDGWQIVNRLLHRYLTTGDV